MKKRRNEPADKQRQYVFDNFFACKDCIWSKARWNPEFGFQYECMISSGSCAKCTNVYKKKK